MVREGVLETPPFVWSFDAIIVQYAFLVYNDDGIHLIQGRARAGRWPALFLCLKLTTIESRHANGGKMLTGKEAYETAF